MTYEEFITPHLGVGFEFRELVKRFSLRFREPPEHLWENMPDVLGLANVFRFVAIDECGARGLRIAAAYRPLGGAPRSAHKLNLALDLDIIGGDPWSWYREATMTWRDLVVTGRQLGFGLYCSPKRPLGIRIHIDLMGSRAWQHYRGESIRPCVQRQILDDLGLGWPL